MEVAVAAGVVTGAIKTLLCDLLNQREEGVKIFVNNKSVIQLCRNPMFHEWNNHIEMRFHFIRVCVEDGKVAVELIGTSDQLADVLMKSLGRTQFQDVRARMGVVDITNYDN